MARERMIAEVKMAIIRLGGDRYRDFIGHVSPKHRDFSGMESTTKCPNCNSEASVIYPFEVDDVAAAIVCNGCEHFTIYKVDG